MTGKIFPEGTVAPMEAFQPVQSPLVFGSATDSFKRDTLPRQMFIDSRTGRLSPRRREAFEALTRTAAITGGTREFKGASGEASLVMIAADIRNRAFRVTFFD